MKTLNCSVIFYLLIIIYPSQLFAILPSLSLKADGMPKEMQDFDDFMHKVELKQGQEYFDQKSYLKAFEIFHKLAIENENTQAQLNLGYMYQSGNGVEKDLNAAELWYQKAKQASMKQISDYKWLLQEEKRGYSHGMTAKAYEENQIILSKCQMYEKLIKDRESSAKTADSYLESLNGDLKRVTNKIPIHSIADKQERHRNIIIALGILVSLGALIGRSIIQKKRLTNFSSTPKKT